MASVTASFGANTWYESGTTWPLPDVEEVATYHRIANGGVVRQSGSTNPKQRTLSRDALVTLAEYNALTGAVGTEAGLSLTNLASGTSAILRSVRGSPGELGPLDGAVRFIVTLDFLLL